VPANRLLPQGIFLVLISVRGRIEPHGHGAAVKIGSLEKSSDLIGNRTRDHPLCSIVPQPAALLRLTPHVFWTFLQNEHYGKYSHSSRRGFPPLCPPRQVSVLFLTPFHQVQTVSHSSNVPQTLSKKDKEICFYRPPVTGGF
jgi:hypothetical protein